MMKAKFIVKDGFLYAMSKAYTGPRTIADVTMASWNQFFLEGGSLNQPSWLESGRLEQLKKQYAMLANLNGGRSDV